MITIQLFADGGESEIDWGSHPFLAVPRAGERVIAFAEGRKHRFFVEEVLNYPGWSDGGHESAPHIRLRVQKR